MKSQLSLAMEHRFVILLSLLELGGSASKSAVLNNIEYEEYMILSPDDLLTRSNNEQKWRNDLAYCKDDLKDEGILLSPTEAGFDNWQTTIDTEDYFIDLYSIVISTPPYRLLSSKCLDAATKLKSRLQQSIT